MYSDIKLFVNIDAKDIPSMLHCISAYSKSYAKGEYIILAGDKIDCIGVLLGGTISVIKEDILGGRHIKATIERNGVFAESIVCAGIDEAPISIVANDECSVLFLPMKKTLTTCTSACSFHSQLVLNLVEILARKNLSLDKKTELLLAKTVKQKVAKYLFECLKTADSMTFDLKYSRNGLAEFLGVDRSVLSRELSKMSKQGIIEFEKNRFKILDYDVLCELAI